MIIDDAVKLYNGFYINRPVGNNAFSFEKRQNKQIYVPPLIEGTAADLAAGNEIVFSEVEEGEEKNRTGLKNFIYFHSGQKDFFIFDNHNHAFFFWWLAFSKGILPPGLMLVHIDQHSDMRQPESPPDFSVQQNFDLKAVFDYTNFVLNVGNFIQPALQSALFSQVKIIDSSASFEENLPIENFVLDIDIDIFAPEMNYLAYDLKMTVIRKYIQNARLITIASSPFFMEQQEALKIIGELLNVF